MCAIVPSTVTILIRDLYMNKYIDIIKTISQNKYAKLYIAIVTNAINRNSPEGYTEKHHIVPKSFRMGGETDKENIVVVTAREHFLLHYLLCKMKTPYQLSMASAFGKMNCDRHGKRYVNAKLYEYYRKNIGKLISENNTGKVSVMKNNITKFINKEETNMYISDGWVLGQYSTEETRASRVQANIKRSGFIWIHNAKTSMQIRKDELDTYISSGWSRGRGKHANVNTANNNIELLIKHNKERALTTKRMINEKTNQIKYVKLDEVENYINNGWTFKIVSHAVGKKWYNDGINEYMIFPNEALGHYKLGRK